MLYLNELFVCFHAQQSWLSSAITGKTLQNENRIDKRVVFTFLLAFYNAAVTGA